MSDLFQQLADAVYQGDNELVEKLAEEVIAKKEDPVKAIQQGGVAGLDRLGQDFEELRVFLPELMLAGEAMKLLIEKLTPYLGADAKGFAGKVVIGCAQGDLHDIGKSLVATQLAVNGFNVIDLGTDVSTNEFIETAAQHNADIIAVSSLMTTSAYYMGDLTKRLKEDKGKYKFMALVGGGPINPDYARGIEAHGYARDAFGAVKVCKQLMEMDEVTDTVINVE